jgi:predicted transposase/invertase (TIGR01784 family)
MLPLKDPIVSIEYQSGELIPELIGVLRNTIVDVRCTDAVGRQFLVEMQLYWSEAFKSRVLFNASKAYVMQLNVGEKFSLLQPVYALNFVNDVFEKSPEMENEYFHHFKIINIKNTDKQIEGLEFLYIELPKFKPQHYAEKKLHQLWLRFLTEIDENTAEIPEELLENDDIREAIGYMQKAAYTKEQLAAYDKWKVDSLTARAMLDEAETKGLEKGRAEGEAIGLEKGERQTLERIVVDGKQNGLSLEQIQLFTKLSKEQIIEILKKHGLDNL